MWQWQAEVAALWMVEDSDGSWSCGKLEVENHAWATQWNCMELDDTLAFPPRPHRAEVAVHGWWGRRYRRKEAMAWYLRMCAELICRGVWLEKSHLWSQKLLDWIGPMKTCRDPGQAVPHGSRGKQSSVDVENTCLEPVTSALSRLPGLLWQQCRISAMLLKVHEIFKRILNAGQCCFHWVKNGVEGT